MNHAFWNAFVIEVGDLLTGVKVLQQSWPSITDCQRIISVINPDALLGGQIADIAADPRRLQISLLPVTVGSACMFVYPSDSLRRCQTFGHLGVPSFIQPKRGSRVAHLLTALLAARNDDVENARSGLPCVACWKGRCFTVWLAPNRVPGSCRGISFACLCERSSPGSKGATVRIAFVSGDDLVGEETGSLCSALAAQGNDIISYVRQGRRHGQGSCHGASATHGYQVVSTCVGPNVGMPARDVLPFVGDWAASLAGLWLVERPDVVHAHGWLGGLAAQLAARRQRIPTIQTFWGLAATSQLRSFDGLVRQTERERIEPLLARNATWVTTESAADVDVLARLRHSRTRLSVLPGGVDIQRYTPVGPALAQSDRHRVLCLASNPLSCNGFDIAIRVIRGVPGTELVIAETAATDHRHDRARAELTRLAAELGVADRVRFVGTVAGDELPMLLRSTDVVLCTPRQPPRATTVLQAMASGVAVVALPVGVLVDAVVHGVTGLVLSAGNPIELAIALKRLCTQRFFRESMGAAGRSRALSRFTWDRIALESQTIYRQLSAKYSWQPVLQEVR